MFEPKIYTLHNPVQQYKWGSLTAMHALFGIPNPDGVPQAELWMGAHAHASSSVRIDEQSTIALINAIQENPCFWLGPRISARFENKLPFLFKILCVDTPLSIQAHPDKVTAQQGYQKENDEGLPADSPERNYKDDNHKPELVCAYTPFWVMSGFRPRNEIITNLEKLNINEINLLKGEKELKEIISGFTHSVSSPSGENERLKLFYTDLLSVSDQSAKNIIEKITQRCQQLVSEKKCSPEFPDPFAAVLMLNAYYPGDISILSPLFLNCLILNPGEAMFVSAGTLHAYVKGVCIELMANSDNVLRGGLTPKKIDINELIKCLNFRAEAPVVKKPVNGIYISPAGEFSLSRHDITETSVFTENDRIKKGTGIQVFVCTNGTGKAVWYDNNSPSSTHSTVHSAGNSQINSITVKPGVSFVIPAQLDSYTFSGKMNLYCASVPKA